MFYLHLCSTIPHRQLVILMKTDFGSLLGKKIQLSYLMKQSNLLRSGLKSNRNKSRPIYSSMLSASFRNDLRCASLTINLTDV
jgi:hypothetical protein